MDPETGHAPAPALTPSRFSRPDHDDRHERWRGGWKSGASMGIMAKGAHRGARAASDLSEWDRRRRGRGRREDLDREFDGEDGFGR